MDITELFPWLFGGGTLLLTLVIVVCSTLPFILIFGGLGWYFYRRYKQAQGMQQASQSWVATTGVVVQSRVEVSGGDTTTVSPRVIYQYQVGAQTYQSDQIKAGDRFLRVNVSGDAYNIVDRYPIGVNVTVYYNPANPTESALER
jgi:hypothetical protein